MRYISTRGQAPALAFDDVLLAGLARDGGLYLPETWPTRSADEWRRLRGLPYAELATEVMLPFVEGSLTRAELAALAAETYAAFDHPAVAPLVQIDHELWLLELFHGPTIAFKDYALQLLGRLFDHVLTKRGERVMIVGATSGDTGSAAIEACRDRAAIDIVILHPEGRTSEVQRRQMTTVKAANVRNVALKGSFDDCQDLVKAMFADAPFRDEMHLSAVNSINWARIMAQIVYYAAASLALGAPDRPMTFAVPTGNFGNVFAAYAARKMGLPIAKLVVGSNRNDILDRFFKSGEMKMDGVVPTLSPSMDIQISSNFERLLFELCGRDADRLSALMAEFRGTGRFSVTPAMHRAATELFASHKLDDEATLAVIAETRAATGQTIDPHTACGLAAARAHPAGPGIPMVVAATAHPAKFPDAVERATGWRPPLPPHMADLFDREERLTVLPNEIGAVEAFVREARTNGGPA
ncbi:threonine synthase [Inquilinus limosus]|uniref:Threonine synthase n=1 Tax=Inquilinus limosus TaxID=171674 RepID=A0A211Z7U7_9PROT|nr:threonine synthase [Inquilinus limosus]OWJ61345.1 threonine synthase [Inquilinus limosus]